MNTKLSKGPTYLDKAGFSARLERRGLGKTRLAMGTARLGDAVTPQREAEAVEAVLVALEGGITVFDTAPKYGRAESVLGKALAQWKGPRPFVSTKVGSPPPGYADYSRDGMRRILDGSLQALDLDRVDLLFVHEPELVTAEQQTEVVNTLLRFKSEGLTRYLGLGGGCAAHWDAFLDHGCFDVVLSYNRLDACCLDAFADDVPRIQRAGAALYAASPLHMGLLGDQFDTMSVTITEDFPSRTLDVARKVKALADARGLALASLAHRFLFAVAEADRVVLGASNSAQVRNALEDWKAGSLDPELFQQMCALIEAGSPS